LPPERREEGAQRGGQGTWRPRGGRRKSWYQPTLDNGDEIAGTNIGLRERGRKKIGWD
jgi:hypothetical protein